MAINQKLHQENKPIMSDNQMLYISSVVCFVLILVSFRYGKQFAAVNLVVFCIYNLFLYYNLFFKGDGGSGFLWWFYLIILTVLQLLIVGIYLGIKFFKQ